MSDDKPTINVTRGSRGKKSNKTSSTKSSTSGNRSRSSSALPSAMEVAQGLAETTRNVWLAGLGAISMAEDAGTSAFNALVQEGKSWEQARRERTNARGVDLAAKLRARMAAKRDSRLQIASRGYLEYLRLGERVDGIGRRGRRHRRD